MKVELDSQHVRAQELLDDLKNSCNQDLKITAISERTRNLAQEVLTKVRLLLDQLMLFSLKKTGLHNDRDNQLKIYFPIVNKKEDLRAALGRAGAPDLEASNPALYQTIEGYQPYHETNVWLNQLKLINDEKHTRLIPQTRIETKTVTVSNTFGSVSWGPGVTFGNGISVMGVPIDPNTQMPIPNDITTTEVKRWVSFHFENTDIDVLELCTKAVDSARDILDKFYSQLDE